ncbi:MAG: hypothetical protein BRD47_07410, partial [Bacteroidetes bacterium QS_8_68_28]
MPKTPPPPTEETSVETLAAEAQDASRTLARLDTETKNRVLDGMADALEAHEDAILDANEKDLAYAD